MISSRTLSIIGLVVGVLSLLFQLLGFLCPGWVVVHIDTDVLTTTSGGVLVGFGNIETQTGVWFSRICVVGDGAADLTCSSAGEHDVYLMGFRLHQALSDVSALDWVEVQVELTLSLVCAMAAVLLVALVLSGRGEARTRICLAVAAALAFVSGVLLLPAVIKVGYAVQEAKDLASTLEQTTGHKYVDVKDPWAMALTAAGLCLIIVLSVILLVAALMYEGMKSPISSTPSIPSALKRMGLFQSKISKKDRTGHIPPSGMHRQANGDLPTIGIRDPEILRFEPGRLVREVTLDDYDMFPPRFGQPKDSIAEEEESDYPGSMSDRFESDTYNEDNEDVESGTNERRRNTDASIHNEVKRESQDSGCAMLIVQTKNVKNQNAKESNETKSSIDDSNTLSKQHTQGDNKSRADTHDIKEANGCVGSALRSPPDGSKETRISPGKGGAHNAEGQDKQNTNKEAAVGVSENKSNVKKGLEEDNNKHGVEQANVESTKNVKFESNGAKNKSLPAGVHEKPTSINTPNPSSILKGTYQDKTILDKFKKSLQPKYHAKTMKIAPMELSKSSSSNNKNEKL